jgi:hypothetical protein
VQASLTVPVWVCARFVPDDYSPTLYWADGGGLNQGSWSTDPNVRCGLANVYDSQTTVTLVDAVVCQVLRSVDDVLNTDLAGIWGTCDS